MSFIMKGLLVLLLPQIVASVLISPWSTEPLSWSTPDNVTVVKFDDSHKLTLPAQFSMMLWVYSKAECAPIDSDEGRPRWWAEIRRHVPDETALAVATVAAEYLPEGLKTSMLGLDKHHCSSIAFLPSGVDLSNKQDIKIAPMDDFKMKKFIGWITSIMRTSCDVKNPFTHPVSLYWVDDSTDERKLLDLEAGGISPQNTFIGHNFVARHSKTNKLLDWWSMDGAGHVIQDKAALLETSCQAAVQKTSSEKLGSTGKEGEGGCVDADTALFNYLYDSSMSKRYALNTVQPFVVHNYTDLGYKVAPLPPGTHKWLKKWYDDNEHAEVEEGSAGAVGTQHEAPWFVRHITWQLKQKLITEIRPYLAEWSGFPEETLEMTSIYGIRRYTRGSVLRMHVDTCMTHVVSAIVNVDQTGMDKDWSLEIMGNDGLYHYVNMKPGEMLFYESAKALHGRPAPLEGDGYSNIFLHFKPTTEGVWDYGWY